MARTVDNRIVEMSLENRNFEENAAKSMKTVDNLNKSLNTLATDKTLDLSKSVKGDSLSFLAESVNTVKDRFSALGVIATTTLQNIATDAYRAGKSFISEFTTKPVFTGLKEYETQINAIQTILSNTRKEGTTLDQVNAALDELNHYADMTIYNFTEMTRNIGTFTAAGVDLDTSVSAIKGIANLAAISGSTSEQASRAMYQLSQAIASGTVNLQDWNSVVNAGMGGQVFQDALKETAHLMGLVTEASPGQSFRESIGSKEGTAWLTSEVLLETLKKFTGDLTEAELLEKGYTEEQTKAIIAMGVDANNAATKVKTFTQLIDTLKEAAQSGWTQSWETIIGDFGEAKTLWTGLSDTFSELIGKSAEARNSMLEFWKIRGGRDDLIRAINNIIDGIVNVTTLVKGAFQDIFPPMTGKKLADLTKGFADFTEKIKLSEESTAKIRELLKGLFSILNIGKKLITAAFQSISPLFESFHGGSGFILNTAESLGQFLQRLDQNFFSMENINAVVEKNQEIVRGAMEMVGKAFEKIKPYLDWIIEHLLILKDRAVEVFNRMVEELSKIDFKGIFDEGVRIARENFTKLVDYLKQTDFATIFDNVKGKFNDFVSIVKDFDFKSFIDGLKGVKITSEDVGNIAHDIWWKIGDAVNAAAKYVEKFIEPFKDMLKPVGEAKDKLVSFVDAITMDDVLKGAETGGLIVIVLSIKKMFDSVSSIFDNTGDVVKKAGEFLGSLSDTLTSVQDTLKVYQTDIKANILLKVAGAIAILGGVIAGLTLLPFDAVRDVTSLLAGLGGALVIITGIFIKLTQSKGEVQQASGILSEILSPMQGVFDALKNRIKMGVLNDLAKTLVVFAGAMYVVAQIPMEKLQPTLIALSAAVGELALMMVVLNLSAKNVNAKAYAGLSTGITGLSIAISILVKALSQIAWMDTKVIFLGIGTIGALILLIGAFAAMVDKVKISIGTTIGIISIAGALYLLQEPLTRLGSLNVNVIRKGMIAITGLLLAVGLFAMQENSSVQMVTNAAGILAISYALSVLGALLIKLGMYNFELIKTGLIGIGGMLAELAISLKLVKGSESGALAIAAMAAAVILLVPPFSQLASLPLDSIKNGLIALGGAFVIFGVAAYALQPVAPALSAVGLALAAIIASIGLAVLAIAALVSSFESFLSALLKLSEMTSGEVVLMMKNFDLFLDGLMQTVPKAASIIANLIAAIAAQLILAFIKLKADLLEGGTVILASILELLSRFAGPISEAALTILEAVLTALDNHIYKITELVVKICVKFLDALADQLEPVLQVIVELLVKLIDGIAKTIIDQAGPLADALVRVIDALVAVLIETIGATLKVLLPGFRDGIDKMTDKVRGWMGLDAEKNEYTDYGNKAAKSFGTGFSDSKDVEEAAKTVTEKTTTSLDAGNTKVNESGKKTGQSFTTGLKDEISKNAPAVTQKVKDIATSFAGQQEQYDLTGDSLGQVFTDGLSTSIDTNKEGVISSATSMFDDLNNESLNTISSALPDYQNAGEEVIQTMEYGSESQEPSYQRSVGDIMSELADTAVSYRSDFETAGGYCMDGLIDGFDAKESVAVNAVAGVMASVLGAAQRTLKVHSPSAAFMWMGEMSDTGLALGLKNFSYLVTNASEAVSNDAINATKDTLKRIADISFEDLDSNPTITPVMDLSNVVAGANTIDGLMNAPRTFAINTSGTFGLSETLNAISGRMRDNEINVNAEVNDTDNKIITALNSLEGRMAQLGEAVTNMQIVMDTGALVGQISAPMDRSLGRMASMKKRGI